MRANENETEKEGKKKRKLKLKFRTKLFILIILIVLYSFTLGTKIIVTKEYKIKTNKLSSDYHGFKILQFSDLHYGSSIHKKEVKNLVSKINAAKADIVIFSGDLINKNYKIDNNEKEFLKNELKKIDSEYGCFYVTGEEDDSSATSILNLAGFIDLKNNEQQIFGSKSDSFLLISSTSKKYFESNPTPPSFKILVIHNPSDYDKYEDFNFDVVLSGHTHNGQINIYGLKNIIINGKYKNDYQKIGNTKLYINRGIGTSKIKARLFDEPTINLYRIYTK